LPHGIIRLVEDRLPEGWTLDRVRDVAQSPGAELWPATVPVVVETYPPGNNVDAEREAIVPDVIIRFEDLALVRPVGEDDWYMGQFDGDQLVCWGSYGPDLERAILAL
jgi:hypothetical protein